LEYVSSSTLSTSKASRGLLWVLILVFPAILILLLGFHRYFESQHFIIRGKFPASRGSIVLVSLVTFALIVASLVVVVAIAPTAFEKK
jgi:uncharacterized membrane protein YidH (DUF202 family)